jgi:hypothetical protein
MSRSTKKPWPIDPAQGLKIAPFNALFRLDVKIQPFTNDTKNWEKCKLLLSKLKSLHLLHSVTFRFYRDQLSEYV